MVPILLRCATVTRRGIHGEGRIDQPVSIGNRHGRHVANVVSLHVPDALDWEIVQARAARGGEARAAYPTACAQSVGTSMEVRS